MERYEQILNFSQAQHKELRRKIAEETDASFVEYVLDNIEDFSYGETADAFWNRSIDRFNNASE